MNKTTAYILTFTLFLGQTAFGEENTCDFVRHLELGDERNNEDFLLTSWSLNPSKASSFATNHLVMESSALLFGRLRDGMKNELAQSFQFDPIKQVATIELNQSCRWSDGEPITAENYIDSFKMIFDPENDSYNPGRAVFHNGYDVWKGKLPFDQLGIKAIDKFTLELDVAVPETLFKAMMSYVSYTPAPSHILNEQPDYWDNYPDAKVVSGPYMHFSNDAQKVVLVPNPYYCDRSTQNFDRVIVKKTNTEAEVGNLIFESKVDIAGRLPARQIRMLTSSETVLDKYYIFDVNDEVIYYFVIRSGKIENPEIREALGSVLDFEYLESNTLGYFLELADSFAFRYPGYNPPKINQNFEQYQERIANARIVLEKHGYSDKNPLTLTFANPKTEIYRYLGEGIVAMLNQLPIKVLTNDDEANRISWNNNAAIVLTGWGSDYADPENFLSYMVATFTSEENKPAMIDLLDRANLAKTPEERFDLLEEIEVQLYQDKTIFPISWFKTDWLVKKNFEHLEGFYFLGRNFKSTDCVPQHLSEK